MNIPFNAPINLSPNPFATYDTLINDLTDIFNNIMIDFYQLKYLESILINDMQNNASMDIILTDLKNCNNVISKIMKDIETLSKPLELFPSLYYTNLSSKPLNSTLNNAVNASDSLFQLYADATVHLNILAGDLVSIIPLVTNSTAPFSITNSAISPISPIPPIIKRLDKNTDLVDATLQTIHNFVGFFFSTITGLPVKYY